MLNECNLSTVITCHQVSHIEMTQEAGIDVSQLVASLSATVHGVFGDDFFHQ